MFFDQNQTQIQLSDTRSQQLQSREDFTNSMKSKNVAPVKKQETKTENLLQVVSSEIESKQFRNVYSKQNSEINPKFIDSMTRLYSDLCSINVIIETLRKQACNYERKIFNQEKKANPQQNMQNCQDLLKAKAIVKELAEEKQDNNYDTLSNYYQTIITQSFHSEGSDSEEKYGLLNVLWFYTKTNMQIIFFPFTFLWYWYQFQNDVFTILSLVVRHAIPLLFYTRVSNIRQAHSSNKDAIIFTKDIYIKPQTELKDKTIFTNSQISLLPILTALFIIIIYLLSATLNIIGIIQMPNNADKQFTQMYGLNFLILIYLLLNISTNIYISLQGNYHYKKSQKEEIKTMLENEDILPNQFYLNFLIRPFNQHLMECVQKYEQQFLGKEVSDQNTLEMKGDIQEDITTNISQLQHYDQFYFKKQWVSGLGLFTQNLFEAEKNSADQLPYLTPEYQEFMKKWNSKKPENSQKSILMWILSKLRPLFIFTYNNLLYPCVLIGMMVKITQRSLVQSNDDANSNQQNYWYVYIIFSLWCNLILYIIIQWNNRFVKKTFQNRLFALERLGLMISLDNKIQFMKAKKDVPTIDLFCTRSLQSWYDLRVMTMQYKRNSMQGWTSLLAIEVALLFLEGLSQFYDQDGDFVYQIPQMNAYLSVLLIVGLVQRITTFLIPCFNQQAKINQQFDSHKRILQSHLVKLKQMRTNIEFSKQNDKELQDISLKSNIFGKKMETFDYFANISIQRQALYDVVENGEKEKLEGGQRVYFQTPEFLENSKNFLEELIFKYSEILGLMDGNKSKHQTYVFNRLPITYSSLSFILITLFSSILSSIIDLTTSNISEYCSS